VDPDGRRLEDYFDKEGRYLGEDEEGVEPLWRDADAAAGEVFA